MLLMETESGTYLYKNFKEEIHRFIHHLEKANDIPDEKNIHQLRADMKQMFAVFHLLEMLFPEKFKAKQYHSTLKKLFKSAGDLREPQVNSMCLQNYEFPELIVK